MKMGEKKGIAELLEKIPPEERWLLTAQAITDNSDQVIDFMPTDLFTSRKKMFDAQRLLKTATGRVGTPNNDINLMKGRYNHHWLPFLDSSYNDYWFMKDDEINRKQGFLTLLFGSPKGFEHDGPFVDFDSKAVKHSWEMEFAAGHNNWQSYLGSKGTNLNA